MVTLKALVEAGLYPNEAAALEEAVRVLWQERPQVRLDWAVHQFRSQQISLARAAALAGVSFDRMKEILIQRGVPLHLGPESLADARLEIAVAEEAAGKI